MLFNRRDDRFDRRSSTSLCVWSWNGRMTIYGRGNHSQLHTQRVHPWSSVSCWQSDGHSPEGYGLGGQSEWIFLFEERFYQCSPRSIKESKWIDWKICELSRSFDHLWPFLLLLSTDHHSSPPSGSFLSHVTLLSQNIETHDELSQEVSVGETFLAVIKERKRERGRGVYKGFWEQQVLQLIYQSRRRVYDIKKYWFNDKMINIVRFWLITYCVPLIVRYSLHLHTQHSHRRNEDP